MLNVVEITRILNLQRNLHWEILSLPVHFTDQNVTQNYRQISLLVHPDKAPEDMKDKAKVAYAAVNEAKEHLTKSEGVKYWQQMIKYAINDLKAEKLPQLTKTKQEALKSKGIAGWDKVEFTFDELEKLPNYRALVLDRLSFNVTQAEFKKKQQARLINEVATDLQKEDEDKTKRLQQQEKNIEEFEAKQADRSTNWRDFQKNKSKNRVAYNLRVNSLISQPKDLVEQYKLIETRMSNHQSGKKLPEGF
eukprot:UN02260